MQASSKPKPNRKRTGVLGAIGAFFRRRLRIERRGVQLHILLDSHEAAHAVASPADATQPSRGKALRADYNQLAELFTKTPDLRFTLRHLAFIEQALAEGGPKALVNLPEKVLAKVQDQLEGLRRSDPAFELPELNRRVTEVLQRHRHQARHAQPDVYISEVSTSEFFEEKSAA